MNITEYSIEKLEDPTGIIEGDRYEIIMNIDVPEDDELYREQGIYVKVIFAVEEKGTRIAQYQLFENETNKYLDFALEDEEEEMIDQFCKKVLNEVQ